MANTETATAEGRRLRHPEYLPCRVSSAMLAEIDRRAERDGLSRADVVRMMLGRALRADSEGHS